MSVSTQHKANKKQITKSNEYLALSSYIADFAQDPNFTGILSPKKANKLQNLSISLLNTIPTEESIKSIISCSIKFICKRPNVKDMNQIFAQNLAHSLGLEGDKEQDIIDCVNSLRAKNEDNVSLKVETVRLNQLVDELRSSIATLKNNLDSCEERRNELEEQLKALPDSKQVDRIISKNNKKTRDLESELSSVNETNKQLLEENEALKQRVALLEAENAKNPEVEELKRKLSAKEEEKQKIIKLFDEMTEQFNTQAEEINKDADTRNVLIASIHKLTKMNQFLAEKLSFTSKKSENLEKENNILQAKAEKCELPQQLIDEMDKLQDSVLRVIPEEAVETIEPLLCKESDTYCERIVKSVSALVEFYSKKEKTLLAKGTEDNDSDSRLNDALKSCVAANMRYLNDIIESKDKSQWIMKPYSFDETRKTIIAQITRINNFLSQFNLTPASVQSVLESLMLDVDQVESYSNISTLLEDFVKPETENEHLLFFYLIQAIAINDIIRKFAYEVRAQFDRQTYDLKQLRNQVETGKEEFNNKINDETMFVKNQMNVALEENEKLRQKLDEIRTKFTNRSSPVIARQIIEIIDGKSCRDIEEEEEEEDAFDQNSSLIKIIENKSEELSNIQEEMSMTSNENKQLKQKIVQMNEEMKKNDEEHIEQIAKIEDLLRSAQEKCENQSNEFNEQIIALKTKNEELTNDLLIAKNNKEAEKKIAEQESTIRALKKENKSISKSLADHYEATQDTIEHLLKKSKLKQERIKERLSKMCNEKVAELEEKDKALKENEAQLKLSEAKINEFAKLTTDLQSELTQTKAKVSNIDIEKKVLSSKLSCIEEKIRREKSLLENQYKLKAMSIETECQLKMESQNAYLNGEMKQLLNCIADNFCDDVNEEDTKLTKNTAMELIQKVAEQIETRRFIEEQLNDAKKEIADTRKALNTPKAEPLCSYASSVIQELSNVKEHAESLEKKIKGMKREVIEARSLSQQQKSNQEWEEWARKINMLISDGYCSISTPQELRFSVEEMVFAAIGNKITWSRLDSLRAQKKLLTSGYNLNKAKGQTLKSMIYVSFAIRRLQKLTGNVQNKLPSSPSPIITSNKARIVESTEKKPLFAQFLSK